MGFSSSFLVPKLVVGTLIRRTVRKVQSSRLLNWPLSLSAPAKFSHALGELRPANPEMAIEFYNGKFTLGHYTVETQGESPFMSPAPSSDWQYELHSFRWMRHLSAANTDLARAHGCGLLQDWDMLWSGQSNSRAWKPEIVAHRVIAWCSHAPLMLQGAHSDQHKILIRSLVRQMRFLHQAIPETQINTHRLHMWIALSCAVLCLSQKEKSVTAVLKELDKELDRQILPDGCPISRNPDDIVAVLTNLLPLRQLHIESGTSPSAGLISSIDRLMSALRFFQHSQGSLGQFNGTSDTQHALLDVLKTYDDSKGDAQKSAPNGGYERLSCGKTTVLMDAGKPSSKSSAHLALAGTLSFELSCGKNIIISNCGLPSANQELYLPYARATAAHSTATINNTSSSRFAANSKLAKWLPSALIQAPAKVWSRRSAEGDFDILEAFHNGYANEFNIHHRRILQLSSDGSVLNGADHFEPANKKAQISGSTEACLRFHLPPQINASLLSNGYSILLAAPDRQAWIFSCIDANIALEESISFSDTSGPRKTEQIVVRSKIEAATEIRWSLNHRKKKSAARNVKASDAEPDLLSGLTDLPFDPEGIS